MEEGPGYIWWKCQKFAPVFLHVLVYGIQTMDCIPSGRAVLEEEDVEVGDVMLEEVDGVEEEVDGVGVDDDDVVVVVVDVGAVGDVELIVDNVEN